MEDTNASSEALEQHQTLLLSGTKAFQMRLYQYPPFLMNLKYS